MTTLAFEHKNVARVRQTIKGFGMDTITLAGPLGAKLDAIQQAGFSQVMLKANDFVGHPQGFKAGVAEFKSSGLRGTGFQVLRDFEGLSGDLHAYKVDIAKSMLDMCSALGCDVLLACSSTSVHASSDRDHIASDLRKLAILAIPYGIKIAYEALSWGRTINEFSDAWDVISRADCPNLGIGLDSFHIFASKTQLEELNFLAPHKIFLVQLADFLWQEAPTFEDRRTTARTFRVFPGEGVHSPDLKALVLKLEDLGYGGDYSFEVFNDDYQQMALETVAQRGQRSAIWLADEVLRRNVPSLKEMRLR
ncbi:MAG: sugar phosphate isomerase/epimerase family protein [Burkholderiaceae bacterium]|jgi:sugar phosphate isomerase/epimerase|tara:strand:- start:1609 stop:2529 length:921 start_codon:yes stop_codon:yes gene_type:complete